MAAPTTRPIRESTHKPRFEWSPQKYRAAFLLAENEKSDEEIANIVGVTRKTIWNWKQTSQFNAQVGEYTGEILSGMMKLSIAKKHKRLRELDDIKNGLLRIVEERGADVDMQGIPGGDTGLVLRKVKAVGTGQNQRVFDEYEPDTNIVRSIMNLHEQAAKELGQWVEKSQVEDVTRVIEIVGVPDDAI